MAFCPRCEHLTASADPTGKAEMYCSRAGCGWDGTKRQAMTPLARAEVRVAELEPIVCDLAAMNPVDITQSTTEECTMCHAGSARMAPLSLRGHEESCIWVRALRATTLRRT